GFFFIPYTIAMLVAGMPLLLLEFSAGQFFRKSTVDSFASIRKWLGGIGWLMAFNAFILMGIYAVTFSWHIIYIFVSFGLQWKSNPSSYFFSNVVQSSGGLHQFYYLSLPVFIALIIAWLIIFFYIRDGFESIKKCFLASAAALGILLVFFLAYSLFLDNSLEGIHLFLKPDFLGIFKLDAWIAAFSLAISSLGLAFGAMHAFARRSEKGFLLGSCIFTAAFELIAGIAVGFIIFGMLGFLGTSQPGIYNAENFSSVSAFTILSRALPYFYKPTILSMMFFALFGLFILLGAASLAYSLVHLLSQKLNTKKRNAAIIVAGLGFLIGLLFAIKPGIYIMDIVSHFAYYNVLIAVLLETIAIGWLFESEKIADFINSRSLLKIGGLWEFWIKYPIPAIVIGLILLQLSSDLLSSYNNYPAWALLVFGLGTVLVPLLLAFLMPQRILGRR
ncbi:hypothetical protein HYS31_07250, partial [Candidatus Woesearchaeota archaeon]|nr:hypothetical protein [Candidatus Woesearchaeota archaeon]